MFAAWRASYKTDALTPPRARLAGGFPAKAGAPDVDTGAGAVVVVPRAPEPNLTLASSPSSALAMATETAGSESTPWDADVLLPDEILRESPSAKDGVAAEVELAEVFDGVVEALLEGDLGLPLEVLSRLGDVGLALLGVVAGQRQVDDLGLGAHLLDAELRQPGLGARLRAGPHPELLKALPVDPLVSIWGVERRAEISGLGPLAGCFLAPGSGLRLVGTVSSRR